MSTQMQGGQGTGRGGGNGGSREAAAEVHRRDVGGSDRRQARGDQGHSHTQRVPGTSLHYFTESLHHEQLLVALISLTPFSRTAN